MGRKPKAVVPVLDDFEFNPQIDDLGTAPAVSVVKAEALVEAPTLEVEAPLADDIPPPPDRDARGDKTPDYVDWMMKYHRAEAVVKYRKWLEKTGKWEK